MESIRIVSTPLGPVTIQGDDAAVHDIFLGRRLSAETEGETGPVGEAARQIRAFFDGRRTVLDFPVQLDGTPFQIASWEAARRIPFGATRTYQWIASEAGNPRASRAAGSAMGRNRLPLIVPCHRVLASGGCLGGFSGGLNWKRFLLALEGSA